jgi:hypothetical protein
METDMLILCDQTHDNWYEHIYSPYYPNSHNSKHFDIYTHTHVFWRMLLMYIGKRLFPDYKNFIVVTLFVISTLFEVHENLPENIKMYKRIEIDSSGESSYRGDTLINSFGTS